MSNYRQHYEFKRVIERNIFTRTVMPVIRKLVFMFFVGLFTYIAIAAILLFCGF